MDNCIGTTRCLWEGCPTGTRNDCEQATAQRAKLFAAVPLKPWDFSDWLEPSPEKRRQLSEEYWQRRQQ